MGHWTEAILPPGLQSSKSTDQHASLVPIKNGNKYYAIPIDALDAPAQGEREGAFIIDDGILLLFSWPSMVGGQAPRETMQMPTEGADQVHVLTHAMRTGMSPTERLQHKFVAHALSATPGKAVCEAVLVPEKCPSLYSSAYFSHLADIDGLMHFERYDRPNRDLKFLSDIYVERASGHMTAFMVCNRPTSVRPGPICTLYFIHESNWYEAVFNFEVIPIADWGSLASAIQRKMEEFEGLGSAFKKSNEGDKP